MINYKVQRISAKQAKKYIHHNHYSKGSHNGPSPCYGLFDDENLIGVLMFATPCSENVRSSVFGSSMKDAVIELHRLHIQDGTPKNTESWFIARCLKAIKTDRPQTKAVLSFSDLTEGHEGTIYKATNALRLGQTKKSRFYRDINGRLRHPRQNGKNICAKYAQELGWTPEYRFAKNRYLWLIGQSKKEKRDLRKMLQLTVDN